MTGIYDSKQSLFHPVTSMPRDISDFKDINGETLYPKLSLLLPSPVSGPVSEVSTALILVRSLFIAYQ
jgi:hypothetical protein